MDLSQGERRGVFLKLSKIPDGNIPVVVAVDKLSFPQKEHVIDQAVHVSQRLFQLKLILLFALDIFHQNNSLVGPSGHITLPLILKLLNSLNSFSKIILLLLNLFQRQVQCLHNTLFSHMSNDLILTYLLQLENRLHEVCSLVR